MNMTKFKSLKPSHSGDISLLVFYLWSSDIVWPKIRYSSSKYLYFLCIFLNKFFTLISYFNITKGVLKKIGQNRRLCAFKLRKRS